MSLAKHVKGRVRVVSRNSWLVIKSTVIAVVFALVGACIATPVSIADETQHRTMEASLTGLFLLTATPGEVSNAYTLNIYGKYDFDSCDKYCPITHFYASLIGEGDPPEMRSYYLGSGFAWKFEEWVHLPELPLFDSDTPISFSASYIPVGQNESRGIVVSIDFDSAIVTPAETD